MTESSQTPALESRFQMPAGWRWHTFTNPQGRKIRFGTVAPESRIPDAVVIVAPGLSEFGEKYFELAHDLLKRNLSMWVIDWQGQGLSDRHLKKNPHKRHTTSFEDDVADFHFFIMEYVKHSAVHPDVGRIPLVLLGHSMGGSIGLRYLYRHPDMFACAAFTSPMLGIRDIRIIPRPLRGLLTGLLAEVAGNSYVFGGSDWNAQSRNNPGHNIFSSDPARDSVHNSWCLQNPALQVGSPTFRWLHEAEKSCAYLRQPQILENIKTPVLIALATQDKLIDNQAARKAARLLPNAHLIEIEGARHEILMESDAMRNHFLQAFEDLLTRTQVRGQLKPF
ncbi:MAG: alpha/beta fold hydrolase [Micavibrio sp.]